MNEIIIHASNPDEAVSFVEEIVSWGVDPFLATVSFNLAEGLVSPTVLGENRYPLVVSGHIHGIESQLKVSGITVGDSSKASCATFQILTLLGFDVESDDILTDKKLGKDGRIVCTYVY